MAEANSSRGHYIAFSEASAVPVERKEHPAGAFVGREREMSQALGVLEEALRGRGSMLLVAGEPGIGKSRFADELAEEARSRGVQVALGRCWEAGGAPAYWPWVQSVRSLTRHVDAELLRELLGSGVTDIAQWLPEVRGILGEIAAPAVLDPDAARFRLFDSVTTFLKSAAAARPLMLILDDLQGADTPSLLLLRFVAGALGDGRILVVGTYRDTELDADHPLVAALPELARERCVRRLTLRGLAEVDVARFIEVMAGVTPHGSLVWAVHDETEGNPLFVQEVIRLLLEEGGLETAASDTGRRISLPQSVREVVGRRLQHLSADSLNVLTLASVMGREFDVDALRQLTERRVEELIVILEEPFAAGIVTDVPGTKGRMRFSHVAFRQWLYEAIGLARRIHLHRRVAQVLEAHYETDLDAHLAELAHHFFEGAPGGDVDKAVDYARRAGDKAVALLAYEEAVRMQRMALQGLQLGASNKESKEQCDILLALGDAQARGGDEAGSQKTFLEAAALSRNLRLDEHLARAALGYGGRLVWVRAGDDPQLIPLLEDGLTAVGPPESALKARIMARLAGALRDAPSREPRESLGRQAVEMARRLADPATLAYTLDGLVAALWRADNPEERLAIAAELVAVGEEAKDRERAVSGRQYQLFAFLELGDTRSVYRQLELIDRATRELRQPVHTWWAVASHALLALLEGRFGEAEPLIEEAYRLGVRACRSDAIAARTLHLFQLRREQGRMAEVEDLVTRSARQFTWYPMFQCALALLHCDTGQETKARADFEGLATRDFADLSRDNEWLYSLSLLCEVAYFLGDDKRAILLYEMLLPYADRNAFGAFEGCVGSVSRYLGLLAAVIGRTGDAIRHFEEGIERNQRMGARPWVTHAQHDLAVALIQRGDAGDRGRASALLTQAANSCGELGMLALGTKIDHALESLGSGTTALAPTIQEGTFRLEGEYWTVAYRGTVSRLRDSKGMRVLAQLLEDPGRPHPSLDLERLRSPGDDSTARAVASGDAGELLDEVARRAYRARLAELRAAVEEADALRRADDVGAMREEMDFLTRELSRALGLGGRSRVAGSTAERARLNVTRAVKSALRRVEGANLDLAAHLGATVRTGTVCVYTPDPRAPITWRVSLGSVHKD